MTGPASKRRGVSAGSEFRFRVADHLYVRPALVACPDEYQPGECESSSVPKPVTVVEVGIRGADFACVPGHVSAGEAWASGGDGCWYHESRLATSWTRVGLEWIAGQDPQHVDPWPLVAYRERPSLATEGTLRHEWRVRPRDSYAPGELERSIGRDWLRERADCEWVCETRRILDGRVTDDWAPRFLERTRVEAADCCDSDATLVDPELIAHDTLRRAAIEAERAEADRVARERAEAESRRRAEVERARRSSECFERMWGSPRWGADARAWSDLVQRVSDSEAIQAHLREDPRARELADAVLAATAIPAKRRAIRAAVAYVGPILAELERQAASDA